MLTSQSCSTRPALLDSESVTHQAVFETVGRSFIGSVENLGQLVDNPAYQKP